jgi:peptidyl-tRNA hydrolase, PTH1 family
MILIVGLGNPGGKYEDTRHNIGFMTVEALAHDLLPVENKGWQKVSKFDAEMVKIDGNLLMAKPQTFMNASGYAVVKMCNFYKIDTKDLWVVHDEMDLPLGKLKIKDHGGSAGHRGIDSIVEQFGTTEFVRFRLGIGHPGEGLSEARVDDYVLSKFASKDASEARKVIKKTTEAIRLALEKGIKEAMNRYNS